MPEIAIEFTKKFWKQKKIRIIGRDARTEPAINNGNSIPLAFAESNEFK